MSFVIATNVEVYHNVVHVLYAIGVDIIVLIVVSGHGMHPLEMHYVCNAVRRDI